MSKDPTRSALPPSSIISSLVQDAAKRQKTQETKGRGTAAHGGTLGKDSRKRPKMTVAMDLELQAQVRQIADELQTFPADVVCFAAHLLVVAIKAGEIDLNQFLVRSDLPTKPYRLEIPQNPDQGEVSK